MTIRTFKVKNPFYLGGVLKPADAEIDIDDDLANELKLKDVLGKEILAPHDPSAGGGDPLTLTAFSDLSAPEQKAELQRLEIEGDAGNKEERVALYAAYLAGGESNAQTETGGSSDGGTGQSSAD